MATSFLIGGIFGLMAMYLRQWLEETPVFAEMQARKALAEELPLKTVLQQHKPAIISMLLTWLLSAAIVVVILMTPTYLQKQFGMAATTTLKANSLAIIALTAGCILAGRIIDRLGSGPTFIAGSLLLGQAVIISIPPSP
jgi:predicted MFS family arabinose efflux permease